MEVEEKHKTYNIVFFDGVCNFCNTTVDMIYKNNKKRDIFYSSLQSEFAKKFLDQHGISSSDMDTAVFYNEGKFYFRSSAVLHISKHLSGVYRVLPAFLVVPSFIRDNIYNWISKNRYKFFGKNDTCRIPLPEEKQYFLE